MEQMKSNLKKLKDYKVILQVEVDADHVEHHLQSVLKEMQKKASLPGFREGKAPIELIEKKFMKEAEEEALKSVIPEAYHQSVAQHKLSPITLPSISEIKFERGKKLTFSAEFERTPDISVKNYKGIRLQKISTEVTPDEVEKGLLSLVDAKAELVPLEEKRSVQKGDFLAADIEIWKENQYVPGRTNVTVVVEPTEGDNFYEQVLGAGVGEVREVSVGQKPAYRIWIRGIQQKKLPLLNDTLAQSFGKADVGELREAVRKDLAAHKKSESFSKMREELFEKLLGIASFAPPQGLVDRQKQHLMDQLRNQSLRRGMTEGQFESEKKQIEGEVETKARRQVQLYFILQKIAELEKITANEAEVGRRIEALAEESKRPLEEVRRTFEEDIRESIKESQTVEFLLANAKLEEPR